MAKLISSALGSVAFKTLALAVVSAAVTAAAPLITHALPGYLQPIVAGILASVLLHVEPPKATPPAPPNA